MNNESDQIEAAPADAQGIENVIDATSTGANDQGNEFGTDENPGPFENIETGILQHDLATGEAEPTGDFDGREVLDLGRVEGLSAAPSTLRGNEDNEEMAENSESGTMEKT